MIAMVLSKVDLEHFGIDPNMIVVVEGATGFARGSVDGGRWWQLMGSDLILTFSDSEAGKKLPFVLVVNLEVPARPNYSLVLYYAADRPITKNSLLGKFVDGSDMFRDSRFKLIPRIVEGYWMVKRAVGTKACLLGKAVTCKYLRQDNFLEIDVDIGSSSVARRVISLVLGYVTSIVVDLAILIEEPKAPVSWNLQGAKSSLSSTISNTSMHTHAHSNQECIRAGGINVGTSNLEESSPILRNLSTLSTQGDSDIAYDGSRA
ncbi:ENHANCED DISEASE RESISTANCE protein [Actinidia rufa]|uniref:ENHANCED DISEASE RESISTANCE protein n=1 Tax=Actinidia rufa TaxID=165716 RepID=A0A7J0FLR4_9ERIC|nr:ENHANCED DISEASE RESISTANCE protein [Actinidia rufa]